METKANALLKIYRDLASNSSPQIQDSPTIGVLTLPNHLLVSPLTQISIPFFACCNPTGTSLTAAPPHNLHLILPSAMHAYMGAHHTKINLLAPFSLFESQ